MIATSRLEFTDLTRQRRFSTDLSDELTPAHTVDQAVHHYLDRARIPHNDLRWMAFSRGVRLDGKSRLADLPEADARMTVLPEVSAG
jgi:hypothetical protein